MSEERKIYLKKIKREKNLATFFKIFILIGFFAIWEVAAITGIIDPFITSQPSRIVTTIINLYKQNSLWQHILITAYETCMGFILGTILGTLIASLLWCFPFLCKVLEPYMVVLNSLPKIALGPIFIVWIGSGPSAIIVITLTISLIVCIMDVLGGFIATDKDQIKLIQTFGGNKLQTFTKVVLPSNLPVIVNALKISVGMSWVGSIVGEFLVSKEGLGYLIVYGSQVFKLDLVMASVLILCIIATVMYYAVLQFEKLVLKSRRMN
ncbi:MAG: ABC transporter permease [Oscillospiraceae bacterium]|nr:ABC transporter permease [Oscillospiraceae bacterium]